MYIVETGIPIPPSVRSGRAPKYPYKGMPVLSSFFVPLSVELEPKAVQKLKTCLISSMYSAQSRLKAKFILRKVENGFRIWRTA